MNVKYKDKMPKPEAEVSLGNLYDMNKQLMAKEEIMPKTEVTKAQDNLAQWFTEQIDLHHQYFMLLCNELRDYTLFNLSSNGPNVITPDTHTRAAEDVVECMTNRGDILAIECQEDGAWEIWMRRMNDECHAYYLFPYDDAVIEY